MVISQNNVVSRLFGPLCPKIKEVPLLRKVNKNFAIFFTEINIGQSNQSISIVISQKYGETFLFGLLCPKNNEVPILRNLNKNFDKFITETNIGNKNFPFQTLFLEITR